jgi:hypothetical protein
LRELYIVELVSAKDEMILGGFVSKSLLLLLSLVLVLDAGGGGVMDIEMRGEAKMIIL